MTSTPLCQGLVVADKLEIVRLLGEGGMGAVYEVEHRYTKHRRALKMLHASFARSPEVVARFLREASAAGRIGSPHIVETHDAGHLPGGEPYLVMDLLRGKPLDAIIERFGQLPIGYTIEALCQACTGVQAAHDAGIVHRDLKPENLFLVTQEDGTPFVKLLDFGISKFDPTRTGDQSLTQDGAQLGTPYYMSPEQILAQPVDGRTDIYSLGVVLYECLAGRRPFEAETLPQLTVLIHQGDCPALQSLRADVPPALAAVVGRAMARDREARYATPAELAAALRAITTAEAFDRTLSVPRDSLPATESAPPRDSGAPAVSPDGSVPPRGPSGTRNLSAPPYDLGSTTQAGAVSTHLSRRRPAKSHPTLVAGAALGGLLIAGGAVAAIWLGGGTTEPTTSAASIVARPAVDTTPSASPQPPPPAPAASNAIPVPSAAEGEAVPPVAPPAPSPLARSDTTRRPAPSRAKPDPAVVPALPPDGAKPTPAATPTPAPPPPAAAAKPVPPATRADQHGLRTHNPFAD